MILVVLCIRDGSTERELCEIHGLIVRVKLKIELLGQTEMMVRESFPLIMSGPK